MSAAVQDLFATQSMQKMGVAGASLGSGFGLGFALGPLIGAKLGGGKAFAGSALGFATVAAAVATTFEETLPLERRKEFDPKSINPFSFVRLFSTPRMAALMTSNGLNSFGEYA